MTASANLVLVRPRPGGGAPRLCVPPLGLLYVAASVERAGFQVAVVDAELEDLDDSSVVARVRRLSPSVVGLTGMTPMRDDIARVAPLLRSAAPRIVLGGVHATRFREQALSDLPDVDALVIGEGEESAVALLRWMQEGERGAPPRGVMVRDQPFTEAPLPDLRRLPRPARHLVPHSRYRYLFQTGAAVATMISSRGCPFRCSFCDKTISGDDWRARDAEEVVDELCELHRRHDVRYVCFFDDNFTLRRKRVVQICEEILRRGLRIDWKCESRADGITPELATLMARAGCRTIAFGVESGNQHALDVLKKDQDPERVAASIRACREAEIETVGYVLVGIPGESPAEARQTLDFCLDSGLDFIQFSTLSPFPGTELYDQAVRSQWFRETTVRNPADAERRRATILPPGWDEETLDRSLRELYGGFYLRPSWAMRQGWRAVRRGGGWPRAVSGLSLLGWLARRGPTASA